MLVKRATVVVQLVQMSGQTEHFAAVAGRQLGVHVADDVARKFTIFDAIAVCVQQRTYANAQQDTSGTALAGTTVEAQRFAERLIAKVATFAQARRDGEVLAHQVRGINANGPSIRLEEIGIGLPVTRCAAFATTGAIVGINARITRCD